MKASDVTIKKFTIEQCEAVYELYSYMVDVSQPDLTTADPNILSKLGTDAGRVVLDVLQRTEKALQPRKPAKVIPMKRRIG